MDDFFKFVINVIKWVLGIALGLYLISLIFSPEDSSYGKVQNNGLDSSVWQVERYLKNNLKDPDSYEAIEWSAVNEMENGNGYYVRHKYRAKNSFGGYVIENKVFFLDSDGNVTYTVDY